MSIVVPTDIDDVLEKSRRKVRIKQAGDHQSIYKFVSLDGTRSWNYLEDTLNDNKLIGSSELRLNDPYELKPFLIDDLTPAAIKAAHTYYDKYGSLNEATAKIADFVNVAEYRNRAEKILDTSRKQARIISFSDNMNSPLLWAHYARSHEGICLHFIGRAFSDSPGRRGFVNYSLQRPTFPMSLAIRGWVLRDLDIHAEEYSNLYTDIGRAFYFVKPQDWEYEGEYRLCYSTRTDTHVKFADGGLVEIVAGSRISNDDFDRLQEMVNASKQPISIVRAKLSKRSFSVEVHD